MATRTSTVKWFDAKKGYGFIHHPEEGEDVFVHYTQIESDQDFKTLRTGQTVEFEMEDGPKGLHALSVTALDEESTERADPPSSSSEAASNASASPPSTPESVDSSLGSSAL